jgi:CheY-like chemotaxis protein
MLAEDEEGVRELLCTLLRSKGYEVLAAGDGVEALELSRGHAGPIDLLVTDVVMPRMDGRELAEQLGQERPEMRVLFMSGHTDDVILKHGVSEGAVKLLQKPFTLAELFEKVREALRYGERI